MVAISISNQIISNPRIYKSNQRGALPPFDSNSYLIAESLLPLKPHAVQNRNLNVFNPDYGLLERPDKMISYLLQAAYSGQDRQPFCKIEFHNYSKNKNQDKPSNVNLYSFFMSSDVRNGLKEVKEEYTIVFTAHHDVVNTYTDNIQDNLASCSHLIALNKRLCDYLSKGGTLHHNVMIAILDEEESGMGGSKALATNLKRSDLYGNIGPIINLELTARGTHFWIDQSYNAASMVFKEAVKKHTASTYANINCPGNDAMPLRAAGFNAACIGTITRKEMKEVLSKTRTAPNIWSICHSKDDKFIYADENDMNYFTTLLFNIASNEWSKEIEKGLVNNKPYGSIDYKNKKYSSSTSKKTSTPTSNTNYPSTYEQLTYTASLGSDYQLKSSSSPNKLAKNGKFNYFTSTESAKEIEYWCNFFNEEVGIFNETKLEDKLKKTDIVSPFSPNAQANGFFKSNLESRTSILNLRDPDLNAVEKFMSKGKFISSLDYLLYKEVNPTLADFYMKKMKEYSLDRTYIHFNHTFYDPQVRHTVDAVRFYCLNEEDFYYMGLLGIVPISIANTNGMSEAEYLAFITGHVIRIIDCDRDLKIYGQNCKLTEKYKLNFDDIFIHLIGESTAMSDMKLLNKKFDTEDKFYVFTEDVVWPFITTYISMLIFDDDDSSIDTDVNLAALSTYQFNNKLFKDFNLSFFKDMFSYFYECSETQGIDGNTFTPVTFNSKLFEAGFNDGQKGGQLLKHVICKPDFAPDKVLGFCLGRIYDNIISYEDSSKQLLAAITSQDLERSRAFYTEALSIWASSIDDYISYSKLHNPINAQLYTYLASVSSVGLIERIKARYKLNEAVSKVQDFTDLPIGEIKQLSNPVQSSIDSSIDTSILPAFIEKTFTSLNSLASKIGKLM